jgi:dynein light intermediate chain 1
MEAHERERSWGDDDFDFVMQTMRTILLKHGASLIYTTPNVKSELQPLVESLLGINTLLKRHSIKHNVVDRDRILVPTNWDSWGKIRILREGFDVEQVSKGWATDLEEYDPTNSAESTLKFYEETIKDSHADSGGSLSAPANLSADALEVHSEDSQRFLAAQLALLEKLKAEDEEAERKKKGERGGAALVESAHDGDGQTVERRLNEHIGPYQFNLGGIQVDVDDAENAIQGIKVRGLVVQRVLQGYADSNDRIAKAIRLRNPKRRMKGSRTTSS